MHFNGVVLPVYGVLAGRVDVELDTLKGVHLAILKRCGSEARPVSVGLQVLVTGTHLGVYYLVVGFPAKKDLYNYNYNYNIIIEILLGEVW